MDFLEHCRKHYTNPHCMHYDEFKYDLKTLRYIKALFRRYITNNEINYDTLLNHFVYLYNCFGEESVFITFYDLEDYYHPLLKTIYWYLGFDIPDFFEIDKVKTIRTTHLKIDQKLYKNLRSTNRK